MTNRSLRVALVVNHRASASPRTCEAGLAALRETVQVVVERETKGDASDLASVSASLRDAEPDVLVAAGGDGTVNLALRTLLAADAVERTALAILPLGTGNNVARSFGLRPLQEGPRAVAKALRAIEHGPRRAVDVGVLGDWPFLGSVALGMDADVLALRNRLDARLSRAGLGSGYGLYLAASLGSLFAAHGAKARLTLDGKQEQLPLFGLCVVNAPVYAGPIRFDAANDCTSGRLGVLALRSAREYALEYAAGWVRYLRAARGAAPRPSARLSRAREIDVAFERPVPAQLDGEWLGAAAAYRIELQPAAVRLCLADSQQ